MNKKSLIRLAAMASGATMIIGAFVAPAGAAGTNPNFTGYGWDGNAHTIAGGGSDTTYRAITGISDLFNGAPGCRVTTTVGSNLNTCDGTVTTNTLGNFDRDAVTQLNPVGSSAGISSLDGAGGAVYSGAVNGSNVDMARSSRAPKTSGSTNCSGSASELFCNTFWGFAEDGVEVAVFNSRSSIQSVTTGLTPTELHNIWNCTYTQWSQVPSLGIAAGSAQDGPIVPFGIQSSSGTYATFKSYIQTQTGDSNFDPNGSACDRKLSTGDFPFENDVKPIFQDAITAGVADGTGANRVPGLNTTDNTSLNNPVNWIWWSSFGELSTFPFKANFTEPGGTGGGTAGNVDTSVPAPVNGTTPSSSNILANTYPIGRTLFHVTRKTDADCPHPSGQVLGTTNPCDTQANQPGPLLPGSTTAHDLNVTGGASGTSGAVREFTRFLCRPSAADQATDPYTGLNYNTEITAAVNKAGFTTVPNALKYAGSRCNVQS